MKRIKQLLLTIALVLWSVAGNAVNYFYVEVYKFSKPIYEICYHYIGDDKVEVEYINMYDLYTDRLIDPIPSTAYYKNKSYRVTAIAEGAFIDYDDMINITFPNSITIIKDKAFYNASGLWNVNIPNSVTNIGRYAFACTALRSITIPNSVTTIGTGAFSGCTKLEGITIEHGATTIVDSMFMNCTALRSITIPNSVTTIGEGAFKNCTNLRSITIPNSVTTIGKGAFDGCTDLTSIAIPNSVTNIGRYAFANCTNLRSITIPNSVTTIGEGAFKNCTNLRSITIPNSVTTIGEGAFDGCSSLSSIYLLGTTPPQLNNKNVFPDSLYSNAVLYIPEGSLATYKAANLWKYFWNIQEYDVTTVENVEEDTPAYETTSTGIQFTNADGKTIAIYTINGALIEKIDSYAGEEIMLDKGVYIFRVGNKTMKVRL